MRATQIVHGDANVTFDEFILDAGKRSAETLIQF